jgi:putative nucleotidyltransferase with HDIG domain
MPAIETIAKMPERLSVPEICDKIKDCPRLPSLRSIDSTLRELLNADNRYTSQISEIIRRDPSLTSRLLRLVNSVYYGLTTPVNSIDEAVFYLGVRQIRQLALVTPVIEDFQKLAGSTAFGWREFWQHCIGTAMLTREVVTAYQAGNEDLDYVGGLVHDVGKIVMASSFPQHFNLIYQQRCPGKDMLEWERDVLGMDHAELGASYLEQHRLPDALVEVARHHHQPERAARYAATVAAVHLADLVVRQANIGVSGNPVEVTEEDWVNAEAWGILFPQNTTDEKRIAQMHVRRSLEFLPAILNGLV